MGCDRHAGRDCGCAQQKAQVVALDGLPRSESIPAIEPDARSKRKGLRFIQLVVVWLLLLFLVKFALVPLARMYVGGWICNLEAQHCAGFGRLLGMEAMAEGNRVSTPDFALRIWFACTGVDYMLYLTVLLVLFPIQKSWRKLGWFASMIGGFYLLSIARLLFLLAVGPRWPNWFWLLHESWDYGFILIFCLVWTAFIVGQLKPTPSHA